MIALEQAIQRLRLEAASASEIKMDTEYPTVNIIGKVMKQMCEDIGLLLAEYDKSLARIEVLELNEKMETGQI